MEAVVKLGGSVITFKERFKAPKIEAINRLSREIAESGVRTVVVHGGGSFGHYVAKRHNVHLGIRKSSLMGAALTIYAMHELNMIVTKSLLAHGIPAISFPPHSYMVGAPNRSVYFEGIEEAYANGFTPVIFGDVIMDLESGFRIVSGDELAYIAAVTLGIRRIVFCLDVDGIYTSDPKLDPRAKLLREVSAKILGTVDIGRPGIDVTGGMSEKLRVALKAARMGIEVIFINGGRHNALKKALKGEVPIGTVIRGE